MIESAVLNSIDYIAIAIMVISTLAGFMKGIIKSIFATLAILLAAAVTVYGQPYYLGYILKYIGDSTITNYGSTITIFIGLSILFATQAQTLSQKLAENTLGGVDRALGLMFGIARACLIISTFYYASGLVMQELPKVMVEAKFYPWYREGAHTLNDLIPEGKFNLKKKLPEAGLDAAGLYNSINNLDKTIKDLSTLKPSSPNGEQKETPNDQKTQW